MEQLRQTWQLADRIPMRPPCMGPTFAQAIAPRPEDAHRAVPIDVHSQLQEPGQLKQSSPSPVHHEKFLISLHLLSTLMLHEDFGQ